MLQSGKALKVKPAVRRKFGIHREISTTSVKGRTIRKLMGGGGTGEVQKKYSRKGKLNEKKFMHAS